MATAIIQDVQDSSELDEALEASLRIGDNAGGVEAEAEAVEAEEAKAAKAALEAAPEAVAAAKLAEEEAAKLVVAAGAKDELSELKQLLRAQARDNMLLKEKLNRIDKRKPVVAPVKDDSADLFAGEGEEEKVPVVVEEEEVSTVEALQQEISDVFTNRGEILELQMEMMSVREETKDIYDVCSQDNFADIIDAIARHAVQEKGGDFNEHLLHVEAAIWRMKKPYDYMYKTIKEYHPTYAKAESEDGDKKAVVKPEDKKPPKKVDAPASIAELGGSDKDAKGGWTSKRIDALPEEKLSTVPEGVYDKYLEGTLE